MPYYGIICILHQIIRFQELVAFFANGFAVAVDHLVEDGREGLNGVALAPVSVAVFFGHAAHVGVRIGGT